MNIERQCSPILFLCYRTSATSRNFAQLCSPWLFLYWRYLERELSRCRQSTLRGRGGERGKAMIKHVKGFPSNPWRGEARQ